MDPTVHDHLGEVYEKTGRLKLAAAQWEESLNEYARTVQPTRIPATWARCRRSWTARGCRLARGSLRARSLIHQASSDRTRCDLPPRCAVPSCRAACRAQVSRKPPHPYRHPFERDRGTHHSCAGLSPSGRQNAGLHPPLLRPFSQPPDPHHGSGADRAHHCARRWD